MRRILIGAAGVLAIGVAALLLWPGGAPDGAARDLPDMSIAAADLDRGRTLYAEQCASCHGADLEGQPGWQRPGPDGVLPAPPHDETGHTWHHADRMLFDYTRLGGAEALAALGVEDMASGMPGFGEELTDAEIRDVLAWIKSTWPEEIRRSQAARSTAEAGG